MSAIHDSNSAINSRASDRYQWMDMARGFAVLLVMLVHGGSVYRESGFELPTWIRALDLAMAPYRMPMLVLLSGFLLTRSLHKGLFMFAYGKMRNILWPYMIWIVIYCLAAYQPERLLKASVWAGGTYLWYMGFLIVYFAVSVFVARLPLLVVAAYAFALSILMPDGSKYGERLFVLMAFFFCGAFAGTRLDEFTAFLSRRGTLAIAPLIIGLAYYSVQSGPINYVPFYGVVILPCIVGICAILYHLQDFNMVRPLRYVGQKSVIFYVVHIPVYLVVIRIFTAIGITSPYVVISASIASALFVCIAFAIGTDRSRFINYFFSAPDVINWRSKKIQKIRSVIDRFWFVPPGMRPESLP